jgi:hypothetical protein
MTDDIHLIAVACAPEELDGQVLFLPLLRDIPAATALPGRTDRACSPEVGGLFFELDPSLRVR